jgi:hypothetical protein
MIVTKIDTNSGRLASYTHISKMLSLYSMAKNINSYCTVPLIQDWPWPPEYTVPLIQD